MAAVTIVKGPVYNVAGSERQQSYNISGNDTNTLIVGFRTVVQVLFDPGVITAYAVTNNGNGTSTITFSASGAFTATNVTVIGR